MVQGRTVGFDSTVTNIVWLPVRFRAQDAASPPNGRSGLTEAHLPVSHSLGKLSSVAFFQSWGCRMSVSLYDVWIPVFALSLNYLAAILDKAASHADTKKVDPK